MATHNGTHLDGLLVGPFISGGVDGRWGFLVPRHLTFLSPFAELPPQREGDHQGHDLVSGWKKKRYDPFIKKYSSRFYNKVTAIVSGLKIHDFNCGLKAYRREVVQSFRIYGQLHRYIPMLAHWQGFRVMVQ